MNKDNTAPAFPTTQYANGISPTGHTEGMTLRDYFAAKAMKSYSDDTEELMLENAIKAYKQADKMMEARK